MQVREDGEWTHLNGEECAVDESPSRMSDEFPAAVDKGHATFSEADGFVHSKFGTEASDPSQLDRTAAIETVHATFPEPNGFVKSTLTSEASSPLEEGAESVGAKQDTAAETLKQQDALKVFERTPEGKMWKAERAREKQEEYKQSCAEWAANTNICNINGGKFSTGNSKSALDWIIFFARQLPGPKYVPKLPPKEGRQELGRKGVGAGFGAAQRFGKGSFTDCDKDIPGAGAYSPATETLSKCGAKFNGSDKMTAMDMSLRQTADLPGPGEYDNYDRDKRDVHCAKLAGRFSKTIRMGRDLSISEAATKPGPIYDPVGTMRQPGEARVKGGHMLQKDGQSFVDKEVARTRDIPSALDTAGSIHAKLTSGCKFSNSVVPSNVGKWNIRESALHTDCAVLWAGGRR